MRKFVAWAKEALEWLGHYYTVKTALGSSIAAAGAGYMSGLAWALVAAVGGASLVIAWDLSRPAAPAKKPAKKAAQQQANPWLTLLLLSPLLALVLWVATDRWRSHPEHPATIVDFNKFTFLPPYEDVEGSPIKLNFYARNKGPKHAFNFKKGARLLIQSGPFSAKKSLLLRNESSRTF